MSKHVNEMKIVEPDDPIKREIKTEQEELTGKPQGFICPECKAHFLYDDYFIEHIKEHHDNTISDNSQSTLKQKSCSEIRNIIVNPVTEKLLQCDLCSFPCSTRFTILEHRQIHHGKSFKCNHISYASNQNHNHHLFKHMCVFNQAKNPTNAVTTLIIIFIKAI